MIGMLYYHSFLSSGKLMKQAAFLELLKANHRNLPLYQQSSRRVSADRARVDGIKPKLYYSSDVFSLINDWDDSYRFVIDSDQNPVFGDIGKVCGRTPGHEEMSNGVCLTAGVLFFDDLKLIGISHESGFFKTELKSLLWAIKTFVLDKNRIFDVAETLTISHFNELSHAWDRLEISTADLQSELSDLTVTASDTVVSTFPEDQNSFSTRERSGSFDAVVSRSAQNENTPPQQNSRINAHMMTSTMAFTGSPILSSPNSMRSPLKRTRAAADLLLPGESVQEDGDHDRRITGFESPAR